MIANMLQAIIEEISKVARRLDEKGWAEGNAGNISVNISHLTGGGFSGFYLSDCEYPLSKSYPSLANLYFLITGAGVKMPELAENPIEHLGFVKISANGHFFSYLLRDGIPKRHSLTLSSELPSHLAIHEYLVMANRDEKAVVHTHVNELIAITHDPEITDEKSLNRILLSIHPEVVMNFPEGIGLVPFMVPGSQEIGNASAESFERHKLILWDKHGAVSIGKSVGECLDRIEIVTKAAKIYFLCKAAGFHPKGLTSEQIRSLTSGGY
jgi:rhamnulose-1-phosphate aldolase